MTVEDRTPRTREELTEMALKNPLNMTYSIGSDVIRVPRDQAMVDLHIAVKGYLAQLEPALRISAIRALDLTLGTVRRETAEDLRRQRTEQIISENAEPTMNRTDDKE